MDVPELGREDRVGPEEIDFAGPGVTSVQCYLTHVRQVLGQVTALPPNPEKASCPALGHVLHGHDYALLPRLAQGSRLPPLQRPAWRWRMRHYNRHPILLASLATRTSDSSGPSPHAPRRSGGWRARMGTPCFSMRSPRYSSWWVSQRSSIMISTPSYPASEIQPYTLSRPT